MANEITVTSTLKYAKGTASTQLTGSYKASQTGDKYQAGIQSVGTSPEETVQKGDIGTIGYAMFKNLDSTNYIQLGTSSGSYSIKLKAGESTGVVPMSATNVYALANTAAVLLEYLMIEV